MNLLIAASVWIGLARAPVLQDDLVKARLVLPLKDAALQVLLLLGRARVLSAVWLKACRNMAFDGGSVQVVVAVCA